MPKRRHLQRSLCIVGLLLSLAAHAETSSLQYDNNGNVTQRNTFQGAATYTYDALNRLQTESSPAKTQTFSYDADGNRLSDGAGSYAYSTSSNKLITRLNTTPTYDTAGNLTADGSGRTFTYNQAGRLYQVFKNSVLYVTYYYNFQGQRTRKVTTASAPQGAQTVLYQYDPQGHLLAELSGTGSPIRTYVWRDDTPIAQIEYQPSRRIVYFEADHLNTPRVAMDETGKVIWRWESDAFGSSAASEDPDGDGVKVTVNLRLPGQYYDAETGFHYNWNRYYDPAMGRYITSDPIGLAGGVNTFAYVNSNPLSYVDPTGELLGSAGRAVIQNWKAISRIGGGAYSWYKLKQASEAADRAINEYEKADQAYADCLHRKTQNDCNCDAERNRRDDAEKALKNAALAKGKAAGDVFPDKLPVGTNGEIKRPFPQ